MTRFRPKDVRVQAASSALTLATMRLDDANTTVLRGSNERSYSYALTIPSGSLISSNFVCLSLHVSREATAVLSVDGRSFYSIHLGRCEDGKCHNVQIDVTTAIDPVKPHSGQLSVVFGGASGTCALVVDGSRRARVEPRGLNVLSVVMLCALHLLGISIAFHLERHGALDAVWRTALSLQRPLFPGAASVLTWIAVYAGGEFLAILATNLAFLNILRGLSMRRLFSRITRRRQRARTVLATCTFVVVVLFLAEHARAIPVVYSRYSYSACISKYFSDNNPNELISALLRNPWRQEAQFLLLRHGRKYINQDQQADWYGRLAESITAATAPPDLVQIPSSVDPNSISVLDDPVLWTASLKFLELGDKDLSSATLRVRDALSVRIDNAPYSAIDQGHETSRRYLARIKCYDQTAALGAIVDPILLEGRACTPEERDQLTVQSQRLQLHIEALAGDVSSWYCEACDMMAQVKLVLDEPVAAANYWARVLTAFQSVESGHVALLQRGTMYLALKNILLRWSEVSAAESPANARFGGALLPFEKEQQRQVAALAAMIIMLKETNAWGVWPVDTLKKYGTIAGWSQIGPADSEVERRVGWMLTKGWRL